MRWHLYTNASSYIKRFETGYAGFGALASMKCKAEVAPGIAVAYRTTGVGP